MHSKINKIIWSVVVICVLFLIFYIIYNKNNTYKEYKTTFNYMDTNIEVRIYSKHKNLANQELKEVEKIFDKYHKLTDKYNAYDGINNIYYIHNNTSSDEYIKLDKELFDLIEYAKDYTQKTDGLVDIKMGNVLDLWHQYRTLNMGVPSYEELRLASSYDKEIILKDDNLIYNNHVNIDLGSIAKGYTTKVVANYLESKGLNRYLINAGGNVVVGDYYNKKGEYKIGIQDPKSNGIFKVIKGNNISVVTSGSYERYYEYNGKIYSHIINPKTLYPENNFLSVTVICNDSALADILSTYLFLIDVDSGIKYIENLDGVEAIWYIDEGNIKKTSGVVFYE